MRGGGAFTDCSAFERVVTLSNDADVADDTLAGCSGVSIYAPYNEDGDYPWSVGLPASGNHILPYGLALASEPLKLEVGQSADLFEGGVREVPQGCELSYSYAATPISVDAGQVTGKKPGTSEVTAVLTLGTIELARATRTVEVTEAAPEPEAPKAEEGSAQDGDLLSEGEPAIASQAANYQLRASVNLLDAVSATTIAVGSTFEQQVNGTWFKFRIYSLAADGLSGGVYVSQSDDPAKKPSGTLVVPETVTEGGATFTVVGVDVCSYDAQTQTHKGGFGGCAITSAVLPETVTLVGNYAFDRCASLSTFPTMPGVKTLSWNSFRGCKALASAELPSKLVKMYGQVFEGCSSLESVSLPQSLTSIEGAQFGGCNSLRSLAIDESNPNYAVVDGALCTKDGKRLVDCGAIASDDCYVIPQGVETVGTSAFKARVQLRSVIIASTVTEVEASAFDYLESLEEVLDLSKSSTFQPSAFARSAAPVVHCYASAVGKWQGVMAETPASPSVSKILGFSTGAPTFFGVPATFPSVEMKTSSSIPFDSLLAPHVSLEWADVDESIATFSLSSGGRVAECAPVSAGSFQAQAVLVYRNGSVRLTLTTSAVTVVVTDSHGPLPTVDDETNSDESVAGWSIDQNGRLTISSSVPVADFEWKHNTDAKNSEHWGPFRQIVTAVDTRGLNAVSKMGCWFRDMTSLADINDLVIPQGTEDLDNLIQNCAISTIPEDFVIPDSVTSIHAMMGKNPFSIIPSKLASSIASSENIVDAAYSFEEIQIESLPDEFNLPPNLEVATSMFRNTPLKSLPEEFRIPTSLKAMATMFQGCVELESLPENFAIPEGVENINKLFDKCAKLSSLPSGFRIPSTIISATQVFSQCPSLTVLPADFGFADGFDLATVGVDMFACIEQTELYYAGSDQALLGMSSDWWAAQNRTLVTDLSALPEGVNAVILKTTDEQDLSNWKDWRVHLIDASGMLVEPTAPFRDGQVFALWYADEACTKRVDFSKPISEQAVEENGAFVLYGKYVAGTLGGELPTAAHTGRAFWSLSTDGTLYIRGEGTIDMLLPDTDGAGADIAWESHRGDVRKLSMAPSVDSLALYNWFRDMVNLSDCSEAFIPKSVSSMHRAFEKCTSLATLPEGFTIPDEVSNLASAFLGCTALTSLPSSFVFSESSKIGNVSNAFYNCTSLASLPDGFRIPDGVRAANNVFYNCPSLTSLPDGFVIPESVKTFSMFSCPQVDGKFVPMYYAGDDPNVLNYDWASQNRVLISDAGDRNMFKVTFKTMGDDGVWTTRTNTLTDSAGFAPDLGVPTREGYAFTGWCTDEECVDPFDFTKPLTADTTLYGKWVVHGGKGTIEGTLPVVEGSGEAWWQITTDGALGIVGDGTVTKLFTYDNNDASKYSSEYWGKYRNEVSSLAMQPGFETLDMECWFALMPKIVDTGTAFVPATCETVNSLFFGSTKLKEVSNDLYISGPSTSVKIASSMFNGCASLERLSDRLTIPSGVEDCRWMFANCTNLKELPASFAIADSATLLTSMFRGCRHLVSLPEDFRIPSANRADVSIASMFQDCNALAALPEGFLIPNLVAEGGEPREGRMDYLFAGCESLTRFPDSFDFPVDLAISSTSPFQCANMTNTYYNGSGAGVAAYADHWAGQNRTIVRSVPSGSFTASFFLPDETTGEYGTIPWTKTFTDGSGMLAELSGPVRAGKKFLGWYSLEDSKKPFDFTKALTEDVDLYGRYAATSGPLPVVGAEDNADPDVAGWKLDSDGTLSVWCAPGKTIARLWRFDRDSSGTTYWGPVRGQVKSVKMREGLLALDVDCWFRDMPQLVDASETFVPEGADSTTYMFASATALPTLANSRLTMPDSVKLAGNMFCDCWALESIPSGFALSKNLESGTGMFGRCYALRSLPSSFVIPEEGPSLKFDLVFLECSSLEMLPSGFTIPARVTTCRSLFSKCSSLSTLPEGFCFEGENSQVTEVHDLFNGCVSLTSLPASLDLAKLVGVEGFNGNLFGGVPEGQQLVTYYPGDLSRLYPGEAGHTADEVKAYWRDKYRRVLVGPSDPLPDAGMRKVEFKTRLVSDSGVLSEWDAYTATVTDATGSFKAPAAPSRYGYLFDGWYKDPDCTTKFAFDADGSATVSADTVLYGKLTLKVAVEVPTRATVMIDATGAMRPAAVQMKSFSPVELAVEKVTCTSLASAGQVVDASALASAKVVLTNATDDETVVKFDASRPTPANNLVLPAASTARPGVLEYTVGLKGLTGSDYRFFGDGWVTDVARLSYVVGPSTN